MELEMNPYVIQIDKFVRSLGKLSEMFLTLEEPKWYISQKDCQRLCQEVEENVCNHCGQKEFCDYREQEKRKEIVTELVYGIENYGAELNIEIKRKLQKKCVHAPHFWRCVVEQYKVTKQNYVWEQKMARSREGCVVQLDRFAQMVQHSTKELDASIFEDEHLEKKIKQKLQQMGVRVLTTVFFVSTNGRYEIHLTAKSARKGQCVSVSEIMKVVGDCTGRKMMIRKDECHVLGAQYCTIVCLESTKFHTLQGIAKIGKGCEQISGDNFSLLELPGGKQGVVLSDGMGAGEMAFKESAMVVDVLEELLHAGFPKETALQMLNTAMVMGREEVKFSTIDMSVFDLYSGTWEIAKAGASVTFWKQKNKVELIKSTSLPIGVVSNLEIDYMERTLEDGDFVIMVTDGVMDALPVGEQELLMRMIIEGTSLNNPKEMAHHILEQVLECSGEVPMDDMTVLVVGIWNLEN